MVQTSFKSIIIISLIARHVFSATDRNTGYESIEHTTTFDSVCDKINDIVFYKTKETVCDK